MQTYDVIIIGAGVAGLTAAQELAAAGLSVVVLEAQSYIGGRIKTFHDWGLPVELGAEFIHGENTVTARLAEEMGLKTISAFDDRKFIDANGLPLTAEQKSVYYDLMDYVLECARPGVSIGELIANNPQTKDATIQRLVSVSIGDYEAGDAKNIDSQAYAEMVERTEHNGGNRLLSDGYQQIVQHLSEGIDVRLDSIVTRIDYSEDTSVAVTLTDGESLYAPRVIVTVSLGVLQHNDIVFTPALPDAKQAAIGKLGMGNAMKFILRLRDPQTVDALFHYADGDNNTLQTITCWWASASDQRILVGFCGGSRADAALALDEQRLVEKVLEDLSKFLGRDIHDEMIDYKIVRWDDNPFTRGAYSNHPVGSTHHDREILAQPVGDRLFWAGEATVFDGNYAFVHGAITSGYRAAKEILSTLS